MFGKLMKYELRSVMKDFLFLWIGILVLSVVNAFTISLGNNQELDGFMGFLFVAVPLLVLFALYIAAFVVALLYVLQRFYRGLLGQEGYLMFTLPVSPAQLIGAKALTALILEVVSVVVAILGGVIILLVQTPADFWNAFHAGWQELIRVVGENPSMILVAAEFVLLMLLSASQANLHLYAGMSLGHLAKKNRIAWSVVAVVGLNMAVSMLSGWLGNAFGPRIAIDLTGMSYMNGARATVGLFGFFCLLSLVLNLLYFFISRWILMHKLNLE